MADSPVLAPSGQIHEGGRNADREHRQRDEGRARSAARAPAPPRVAGSAWPGLELRSPTLDAVLTRAVRAAVIQETERLRSIVRDELTRAMPARQAGDPDEILTVEEAATDAKCSVRTVAAACKTGKLDGHKPPGLSEWRITRAALRRWAKTDGAGSEGGPADRTIDIDAEARSAAGRLLAVPAGARRRNR